MLCEASPVLFLACCQARSGLIVETPRGLCLVACVAVAARRDGGAGRCCWCGHVNAARDLREIFEVAVAARLINGLVAVNTDVAVELHARSGRNQSAHDDVLLEAAQVVYASRDCRFGQYARR